MIRAVSIVFWVLAFSVATGVSAHRQPEATTTISFNTNTGFTEIVHRLHVHDVEPNLDFILEEGGHTLETLEGRARLALYVGSKFSIRTSELSEPVELTLLGAELRGSSVYVYQEYEARLPEVIFARNDVLREVFENQVNIVTFVNGSEQRSLVFSDDDEWKEIGVLDQH